MFPSSRKNGITDIFLLPVSTSDMKTKEMKPILLGFPNNDEKSSHDKSRDADYERLWIGNHHKRVTYHSLYQLIISFWFTCPSPLSLEYRSLPSQVFLPPLSIPTSFLIVLIIVSKWKRRVLITISNDNYTIHLAEIIVLSLEALKIFLNPSGFPSINGPYNSIIQISSLFNLTGDLCHPCVLCLSPIRHLKDQFTHFKELCHYSPQWE